MTLAPPYTTPRNPALEHQVIFYERKMKVHVSCNCRSTLHPSEHSMGQSGILDTARRLYNNPDNHVLPFGKEDEAKW